MRKKGYVGRIKKAYEGLLLTTRDNNSFVFIPCGDGDDVRNVRLALKEILEEVYQDGYDKGLEDAR